MQAICSLNILHLEQTLSHEGINLQQERVFSNCLLRIDRRISKMELLFQQVILSSRGGLFLNLNVLESDWGLVACLLLMQARDTIDEIVTVIGRLVCFVDVGDHLILGFVTRT